MDWGQFLTPTLGVGGLVILAVLMLMRGDLVTRKQVDTLLQVKDEQVAFYRAALEETRDSLRVRDQQIAALMVTAQTTRKVLEALPEAAAGLAEGGGHVPASEAD
jgi:hypothetical protein